MTEIDTVTDNPVAWMVDDIEVNASLTLPQGAGPFPAVIMVAGSGPTDRDWNTPLLPGKNGSAALLARALTNAGFITLRYDKRAAGAKVKENIERLAGKISMQGHLEELAGGVRLLASRKDVDQAHLFALTNSEGCLHALNYQIQAGADLRFSALILTSAPARPIGAVARSQIAPQLAPLPDGDQYMAAYDEAIQDFEAARPVTIAADLPEMLRNIILSLTNPFNLPFARELWSIDAAKLIERVPEPILILLGKKDIQVSWQTDGVIFDKITQKQANVEIAYAENANHVLKYEPKPMAQLTVAEIMGAYNADDIPLDTQAEEMILAWLKARV